MICAFLYALPVGRGFLVPDRTGNEAFGDGLLEFVEKAVDVVAEEEHALRTVETTGVHLMSWAKLTIRSLHRSSDADGKDGGGACWR